VHLLSPTAQEAEKGRVESSVSRGGERRSGGGKEAEEVGEEVE